LRAKARQGGKRAEEGHVPTNSPIMVKAALTGRAISDPSSVKLIVERKIVGDALRIDPERTGCDQRHLRLPEAAPGAIIADQRLGPAIADDLAGAALLAMFEVGEQIRGHDADAGWIMAIGAAADLPKTPGGRSKGVWDRRRNQQAAGTDQQANKAESNHLAHVSPFTTHGLTQNNSLRSLCRNREAGCTECAVDPDQSIITNHRGPLVGRETGDDRGYIVGAASASAR